MSSVTGATPASQQRWTSDTNDPNRRIDQAMMTTKDSISLALETSVMANFWLVLKID